MEEKSVAVSEECVEAELVHEGGSEPRQERPRAYSAGPLPPAGVFGRFKRFLGGALLLAALALMVTGGLLTVTVIGAILGIPLLIAGAALLGLFFKLFASSLGSSVVFRKFP
ncbi:MAG: hypothetical protein WCK76_15205, partial [Elusimicrobiota bacterium]